MFRGWISIISAEVIAKVRIRFFNLVIEKSIMNGKRNGCT